MRREDALRLHDMLLAARNIATFVDALSKDEFLEDVEKQYAVLHGIEIIGEAAAYITDETKRQLDLIPWDEIRGMRNRLAHEYFAVDLNIVWDTVETDLSLLIQVLSEYVNVSDEDDDSTGGIPVT